jgi:hypothetical protein
VIVKPGPVRDERREDQQALEEIRHLFARYREIARHGRARERDASPVARTPEPPAKRVPGR